MKKYPYLLLGFVAILGLAFCANAQAASGTWDTDLAGDWTDITKWQGDAAYASDPDSTATLGNFITLDRIINLDAPITIGNITASDTDRNYTIAGTNSLTLDRTDATAPTINVTQSGRTLTINSHISGSDGLAKSGAGILRLGNTNNNFTGGTVLNAGTISFGSNSEVYLGDTSGGLTFNGGQISYTDGFVLNSNRAFTVNSYVSLANRIFVNGVLSGNGSISMTTADSATFSNTGNTFTGTVNCGYAMSFASLGDSSNTITLGRLTWTGPAKTFAIRPFALQPGSSTLNNSGSGALVIQQDIILTGGTGARTLNLGGSYSGSTNIILGNITDETNSAVGITKSAGAPMWALSGTNTYTGTTRITENSEPNGELVFQGIQALSPDTTLYGQSLKSNGGRTPGNFKILDDSASPESRSGVNISLMTGNGQDALPIFIGNNGPANGGNGTGGTTGSIIQLGNMAFSQSPGATGGGKLAVTGANGYKLEINNVSVTLETAYAGAWNTMLTPTTAPLTIRGTVQQVAGSAGTVNLQLDGTATNNLIAGSIMDSADGTPQQLSITKQNTSTWILSGPNTYSGTTIVSGGTLVIDGGAPASLCLPDTNSLTISGSGKVQLNTGVKEKVGSLYAGAVKLSDGKWGSPTSAATFTTNLFLGTGILYVNLDIPALGTILLIR